MPAQPTGSEPSGFEPAGFDPPGFLPAGLNVNPAASADGFNPPGFDPAGFDPAGFNPPVVVPIPFAPNELDIDLVADIKTVVNLTAEPMMIPPGPNRPVTITYTFVAEVPVMRLSGASGLTQRTYQIDIRSTRPEFASPVVDILRKRYQGFRGVLGTNRIRGAQWSRIPSGYDPAVNKSGGGTYRLAAQLVLWYLQPLPTF